MVRRRATAKHGLPNAGRHSDRKYRQRTGLLAAEAGRLARGDQLFSWKCERLGPFLMINVQIEATYGPQGTLGGSSKIAHYGRHDPKQL
jgi:hypothetical protein